jgi:hypothetical protein
MFTITNEQKKALLESAKIGAEMELYQMLLIAGHDPDNYDLTEILKLEDAIAPSNENRMYATYNKLNSLIEKIESL